MTIPSAVDVAVIAPAENDNSSYVDWPAIIAGIVLASAISLLLLAFGSAIGLSFTDFRAGDDVSPLWIAIAAASWLLWVQISSFMAGGYITGRMRRRHNDASEHEVDVRDGAHGLLVWAGALVVGGIIAVSGLGAAASAIGSAASTLTVAASNVAGEAVDPNAYFVDSMFRPAPASGALTAPAATDTNTARAEAGRIFAQATLGEVSPEDRTYLAQSVARATGLSEADATARVDQTVAAIETAKAEAVALAERARQYGVLAAFLTAASLLVSAVGAFWAAQKGGRHRDEGTAFAGIFRRF